MAIADGARRERKKEGAARTVYMGDWGFFLTERMGSWKVALRSAGGEGIVGKADGRSARVRRSCPSAGGLPPNLSPPHESKLRTLY